MITDDLTDSLRFANPALRGRISAIMQIVADAFEIPARALMERTRAVRIAEPRQVAMMLIRENSNLSLMDVGSLFQLDHGTVIHAIKAVRRRRAASTRLDGQVAEISRQVRHRFPA